MTFVKAPDKKKLGQDLKARAAEMERTSLNAVIDLVEISQLVDLSELLEHRVLKESVSLFNSNGTYRKTQKNQLIQKLSLQPVDLQEPYIALIDMGMIWRMAIPSIYFFIHIRRTAYLNTQSVRVRDLGNYRYPVEKIGEYTTQYGKKDPSSMWPKNHRRNPPSEWDVAALAATAGASPAPVCSLANSPTELSTGSSHDPPHPSRFRKLQHGRSQPATG
ncbi:hypothetical protein GQR58_027692 [Nymphon striatum]|nr:hypothetical protein GQR58_027692 [Nymphon striatum]